MSGSPSGYQHYFVAVFLYGKLLGVVKTGFSCACTTVGAVGDHILYQGEGAGVVSYGGDYSQAAGGYRYSVLLGEDNVDIVIGQELFPMGEDLFSGVLFLVVELRIEFLNVVQVF